MRDSKGVLRENIMRMVFYYKNPSSRRKKKKPTFKTITKAKFLNRKIGKNELKIFSVLKKKNLSILWPLYGVLEFIWDMCKQLYAKRYHEMWCHTPYEKKNSFSQCQLKPNLALKLCDLYNFFRLAEKGLLTSFVSWTVECYFR